MLDGEARRQRLDVLHAPVNVLPRRLPCPGIVTIHDLAFLRLPECFRPARRRYQQYFTRQSAQHAVHLQIGRLLLARVFSRERWERLFEIVDHLNMGRELLIEEQDRMELAQLNLEAGRGVIRDVLANLVCGRGGLRAGVARVDMENEGLPRSAETLQGRESLHGIFRDRSSSLAHRSSSTARVDTEDERPRATVYMQGLAEMRKEFKRKG